MNSGSRCRESPARHQPLHRPPEATPNKQLENQPGVSDMSSITLLECPSCRQKLGVPTDKGRINLTCPKCLHLWEWVPFLIQIHIEYLLDRLQRSEGKRLSKTNNWVPEGDLERLGLNYLFIDYYFRMLVKDGRVSEAGEGKEKCYVLTDAGTKYLDGLANSLRAEWQPLPRPVDPDELEECSTTDDFAENQNHSRMQVLTVSLGATVYQGPATPDVEAILALAGGGPGLLYATDLLQYR
jgi:hypothetical protein